MMAHTQIIAFLCCDDENASSIGMLRIYVHFSIACWLEIDSFCKLVVSCRNETPGRLSGTCSAKLCSARLTHTLKTDMSDLDILLEGIRELGMPSRDVLGR